MDRHKSINQYKERVCSFEVPQSRDGTIYSYLRRPLDSIREAVLTVSPNRQYRGILSPTTPAHTDPETTKTRE